jgi:anion-transporting  ArsA/GET3 family ATPase
VRESSRALRPADWLERELLVTVGTGGVGKTTLAAALGLAAARKGRRVLVLTIDPARRLADALGLERLDHEERELPGALRARAGLPADGRFFAMMLDTRRAFDELAARLVPDPSRLARLQRNAIYRNLSDALAGSREYSALEKLHELHAGRRYDLIVVDTPPAGHALEFLDAPRRLAALLQSGVLRALLQPSTLVGKLGLRALRGGSEAALRALQRVTGSDLPASLADFISAIETPLAGIEQRAQAVHRLLRSDACAFVLVAGPEPGQIERARALAQRLGAEQIPLVGAVINRVRVWPGDEVPPELPLPERARLLHQLEGVLDPATAGALLAAAERQARLARRDAQLCEELARELPLPPGAVRRVPLLCDDVAALDALLQLRAHLLGV